MYQERSAAGMMKMPSVVTFEQPAVRLEKLDVGKEAEVLAFLADRPLHTVVLAGFVRDNGLVSPLNRGSFYSCRDQRGEIEGVALIGHATFIETRTDRALQAFAEIAQKCTNTHMILGEQERISEFWNHYSTGGQPFRLACRELLFELLFPVEALASVPELRPATEDDLELVVPVHAQMAFDESGVNPLEVDPIGFRTRCARRIDQGRTWVMVKDPTLIFKADIISDTPEVIYLEGIWVNPTERGKEYGLRCMSELARNLLQQTNSICLLVDERRSRVHDFYRRAGFVESGIYDTIFLNKVSIDSAPGF